MSDILCASPVLDSVKNKSRALTECKSVRLSSAGFDRGTAKDRVFVVVMAKQDEKSALVEQARLAERSERYDDMADYMEQITKLTKECGELATEERNLLSVAFKNVVGSRRSSWRIITSLEQKEEFSGDKKHLIENYRGKVENELTDICDKVLVSDAVYACSKNFFSTIHLRSEE